MKDVVDRTEAGMGGDGRGSGTPASGAEDVVARSHATIFLFWVPLAAQWLMMGLEGPFLAAVIARMAEPAVNLAAYGVAFAFAILVESPVIMLMSAATALVEDASSYRKLRNFANGLNAGATALMLLFLLPPVHATVLRGLLGLPDAVATQVHTALWLLLPWPAAIGYRRFLHGVLIRSGRTRQVAYGTVIRLAAMAGTAIALYVHGGLDGASVGAVALSAGVCAEALAARVMAAGVVRELLGGGAQPAAGSRGQGAGAEPAASGSRAREDRRAGHGGAVHEGAGAPALDYRAIARFYFPLALTSLIGLTVNPMLTFFMGRATLPLESLAVYPVVHGLSFLFRAPAFSFQEVVIALLGQRFQHAAKLARFAAGMAMATAALQALVAFTPLAFVWFETVSGLTPDLAALAIAPTRILVPFPAVAVGIAYLQGALVRGRTTRAITVSSAVEVASIAILFAIFGWGVGMFGASAAMLALLGGRVAGAVVLIRPLRRVLHGG